MSDDKIYSIEFKDIIYAVKKRLYIVLLITVPSLLLGAYYGFSSAKVLYQARISLIIGNYLDDQDIQFRVDDISRIQQLMGTYSAIAKTTLVSEKTVKKLDINISPAELRTYISAIPQPGTPFMDLVFIWSDPKEAIYILDIFSGIYMEEARNIYSMYDIKVLEKDRTAQRIVVSKRQLYTVFGFAAGIIVSLLLIFALEFINSKLSNEEEIENALDIPVLGLIPKHKKMICGTDFDRLGKSDYYVIEAYKALRSNTFFTSIHKGLQTIAVTSGMPGEGKTSVALMLAKLMAYEGKKIALIDCNLRNPDLHNVFQLSNAGLVNIINQGIEWKALLNTSRIENLYIMGVGSIPHNPPELLSSPRMKEMIDKMKKEFDYIILDTPSVNIVTDAQVISPIVDGYLIVVSSGKTKRENVIKTKKLIQYANGVILGVVLNRINNQPIHKHYKYYYKKGRGYCNV